MERHRSLWKAFLSKEKLFLVTVTFIFIIISTIYSFQQSIFSSPGYQEAYPNAGLEFFLQFISYWYKPIFIYFTDAVAAKYHGI